MARQPSSPKASTEIPSTNTNSPANAVSVNVRRSGFPRGKSCVLRPPPGLRGLQPRRLDGLAARQDAAQVIHLAEVPVQVTIEMNEKLLCGHRNTLYHFRELSL